MKPLPNWVSYDYTEPSTDMHEASSVAGTKHKGQRHWFVWPDEFSQAREDGSRVITGWLQWGLF